MLTFFILAAFHGNHQIHGEVHKLGKSVVGFYIPGVFKPDAEAFFRVVESRLNSHN